MHSFKGKSKFLCKKDNKYLNPSLSLGLLKLKLRNQFEINQHKCMCSLFDLKNHK